MERNTENILDVTSGYGEQRTHLMLRTAVERNTEKTLDVTNGYG